jgi:hypothetical protein
MTLRFGWLRYDCPRRSFQLFRIAARSTGIEHRLCINGIVRQTEARIAQLVEHFTSNSQLTMKRYGSNDASKFDSQSLSIDTNKTIQSFANRSRVRISMQAFLFHFFKFFG